MEKPKKKSEKVIFQEGFLKNFLGGALVYGFLKGSQDRLDRVELKRGVDSEKERTKTQMKKDNELKRLLEKFSSTSTDLFQYVKKNKDKGGVYLHLYTKLAEFY